MNTTVKVENLKCHGCANTITEGIKKFKEVNNVNVNVEESLVEIEFEGNEETIQKYRDKLKKMGYPADGNNSVLTTAKSYFSCAVGRLN